MDVPHAFQVKTFRLPTQCDHCRKMLWGIARQGFTCQNCGVNVHQRCMQSLQNSDFCDPTAMSGGGRRSLSGTASADPLAADAARAKKHRRYRSIPWDSATLRAAQQQQQLLLDNDDTDNQNGGNWSPQIGPADSVSERNHCGEDEDEEDLCLPPAAALSLQELDFNSAKLADVLVIDENEALRQAQSLQTQQQPQHDVFTPTTASSQETRFESSVAGAQQQQLEQQRQQQQQPPSKLKSRRGLRMRHTSTLSSPPAAPSPLTPARMAMSSISPAYAQATGFANTAGSSTVSTTRRRMFGHRRRRSDSAESYGSEDGLANGGGAISDGTQKKLPGVGVLRDFIQTTAEKAIRMDKEPRGSPRLNVFTTLPKNFTRFVMKVGPLAEFQHRIERLIFWETPSETLFAMSIYILLCLNPNLLIFAPQAILLAVLTRNYYAKASRDVKKAQGQKLRRSESQNGKPVKPSKFRPDNIHYRKNMQFIQNTMGMYCDAYEGLRLLNTKIDWSDEAQTSMVLQMTILSMVAVGVSYWYIPWNLVFLVVGVLGFLVNTAIGRASQTLMLKYADQNMDALVSRVKDFALRRGSYAPDENGQQEGANSRILIECVENQRWWAGLSWIPHMLRTERPPWSNLDGSIASKPKSELTDPSEAIHMGLGFPSLDSRNGLPSDLSTLCWKWVPNSAWVLDQSWIATTAGTSTSQVQTDEEGWVYTDQNWNFTKKKNALITRRRRWVRAAVLAEPLPVGNATVAASC